MKFIKRTKEEAAEPAPAIRIEDELFMTEALKEAKKAYRMKETPIGCVIVHEGKIIARGHNRRDHTGNVLAHAEIEAIRRACRKMKDWRLEGCTMYVTLEPCPMCAGAIVQSRMDKLVIGTMSPKAGCAGSILNLLDEPAFNHQVEIVSGVCREQCSRMLTEFFAELRKAKPKKGKEEPERSPVKRRLFGRKK